jgi:hypothetical protein
LALDLRGAVRGVETIASTPALGRATPIHNLQQPHAFDGIEADLIRPEAVVQRLNGNI